jgi:hypothetical protein
MPIDIMRTIPPFGALVDVIEVREVGWIFDVAEQG